MIITDAKEFGLTPAQERTREMIHKTYNGPFHSIHEEWQDGTDYWVTILVDGCKQTAQFGRDGRLVGDWIV